MVLVVMMQYHITSSQVSSVGLGRVSIMGLSTTRMMKPKKTRVDSSEYTMNFLGCLIR